MGIVEKMADDYENLKSLIRGMGGVLVGYSGGVDSTLVAKAAKDALGDRAVCVLIESCLMPASEVDEAVNQAKALGLNLIRIHADVLADPDIRQNRPDRCYHCKKTLFGRMIEIARELGLGFVLDGANKDDAFDYRPGARATFELGVRSPLNELGLGKEQVREISKELNLPTWKKPSRACLASRIPYGTPLTVELLKRIEQAEAVLAELGFEQFRVRDHGEIARIEVSKNEVSRVFDEEVRRRIVSELKNLGYSYITLDLTGYRTGSMNETLKREDNRGWQQ
ncbi:MAG: ATP-dependent sacrificial sulfur transferase LarE [Armatimonadetes bacterium]|nr:ATP-dependent sacrificial sulfur transferase LarE [Armatimonadota bacterium]